MTGSAWFRLPLQPPPLFCENMTSATEEEEGEQVEVKSENGYVAQPLLGDDKRRQLENARVLQENILLRMEELEPLRHTDNWTAWEFSRLQNQLQHARMAEKNILEEAYSEAKPIIKEDVQIQLELLGFKDHSEEFLDSLVKQLHSQIDIKNRKLSSDSLSDDVQATAAIPNVMLFSSSIDLTSFPIPLIPFKNVK